MENITLSYRRTSFMETIKLESLKDLPKDKEFHCIVAAPNDLEAITHFKSLYNYEPPIIYQYINSHGAFSWYIPVLHDKITT